MNKGKWCLIYSMLSRGPISYTSSKAIDLEVELKAISEVEAKEEAAKLYRKLLEEDLVWLEEKAWSLVNCHFGVPKKKRSLFAPRIRYEVEL